MISRWLEKLKEAGKEKIRAKLKKKARKKIKILVRKLACAAGICIGAVVLYRNRKPILASVLGKNKSRKKRLILKKG